MNGDSVAVAARSSESEREETDTEQNEKLKNLLHNTSSFLLFLDFHN